MANNQMPHNIDAEIALLGSIIIDASLQSELLETLREEDFYQESHRYVLSAMQHIYHARKTVDLVTLTDQLEREGTLEKAGGHRQIAELAEFTPSTANYKQYLEIVRRDSVNRTLIRAAKDIIENSLKNPEEQDGVAFAEKIVFDISRRGDSSSLYHVSEGTVIDNVIRKFENIQADPTSCRGVETGFKHLDRITNGLQKSDLIVIAARPGAGKTSLAMNIVENVCINKGKVAAVFSLEMPREQLVQRLLCAHAGVSMEKALSGKLAQKEWKRLMLASEDLRSSRLCIDDCSKVTAAEILSKCRRLAAQAGSLDLVMVDYIQLMSGGSKYEHTDNRVQEVAAITRDLKLMAKELNVPVIALSQLRRIQSKEPQLSDLRESGAIEQDADIVMFINRLDDTKRGDSDDGKVVKGATEIHIAKHRNGALGRIQLRFLGESTKFVDVEDQDRPTEEPNYSPAAPDWENSSAEELFPPQEDTGIPLE